jgi:hypothetical protein
MAEERPPLPPFTRETWDRGEGLKAARALVETIGG